MNFKDLWKVHLHISSAHSKLFYKRFYRSEIVDSLNLEGVIETGETQMVEYRQNISNDPNYNPPTNTPPPFNGWRIFRWGWILNKPFIY
jgi:Asp-tRNA(Asn)/Glu-tRNA(Gln) amidotransferase A subunit family amidase